MAFSADLKLRLEKKSTFEAALNELLQAIQSCSSEADLQQLLPLVKRAFTLLKTRYSNVAWWRQGLALFVACKEHQMLPRSASSQLDAYIAEASSFAADEPSEQAAAAAPAPTLGELLFGLPPQQAPASHLSDAGLVLDGPAHHPAVAAAIAAAAAAAATRSSSHTAPEAATSAAAAADTSSAQPDATQPETAPEAAVDAADDGGGGEQDAAAQQLMQVLRELLPAEALEQLQGEGALQQVQLLEAERLAALLAEAPPPSSAPPRPPAAKAVVASLPTLTISKAQAGSDRCPVCTEDFQEGDTAQQLPCSHMFHPECLKPWVSNDNSCPTCRKELPTDDWRYEARKERQQQDEEDRKGAENALSHNEFMYT